MSASESPAASSTNPKNAVRRAELDVSKLHELPSEQQDLYLLTFTSDLVQYTATIDKDELYTQQAFIKNELFKILRLSSPTPTRVVRNNVGRCFGTIFKKGNRATLYETVTELVGIINAGKNEMEVKTKFVAVIALGDIFAAAGDSIVSQSSVTCSSFLKLLKLSQNHTGLRSSIYMALKKVIEGIGSPVDEPTARDIWKHARNAAISDKANTVQARACQCLEHLIKSTHYFGNVSDYDNLKTTLWRVIDSSSLTVRHAAAFCLATILVKSRATSSGSEMIPNLRKPRKQTKKQAATAGDDDEPARSESPASRKREVKLSFKLVDILKQLSTQYNRSATGNRARAGIAVCYKQILRSLGDKIVEECYAEIAAHLLVDLSNHPVVTLNRYRLLMTRKFVKNILEDTVSCEILQENAQLNAARWLINDILKDYPKVVQERREPSKHTLTGALSALSSLISSLGSAIGIHGDSCREALLQVLQHPSYTVQIHAALCLRNFVLACPQQLLSCVTICMNSLSREINQLSTPRHSPRRCLGYAHGLAATLSTSRLQPLYGAVDVYSRVLSQATNLLKTSSNSELRIASTQIQVAWILIGGLMPLGPSFTKIHLPQLLLLWKNALPKPLQRENLTQRGPLEMSFLAHVRECALSSIFVFLEFNSKLVTSDGARRVATMLQNTIMFLDNLPRPKSTEDISQRLFPSMQLRDFVTMVRRRVLQCFAKLVNLSQPSNTDILSLSNILGLAISSFADPDVISADSLESFIAGSSTNFESLWELGDNFGFGMTGLAREFVAETPSGRRRNEQFSTWTVNKSPDHAIDDVVSDDVLLTLSHTNVTSWLSLYVRRENMTRCSFTP